MYALSDNKIFKAAVNRIKRERDPKKKHVVHYNKYARSWLAAGILETNLWSIKSLQHFRNGFQKKIWPSRNFLQIKSTDHFIIDIWVCKCLCVYVLFECADWNFGIDCRQHFMGLPKGMRNNKPLFARKYVVLFGVSFQNNNILTLFIVNIWMGT